MIRPPLSSPPTRNERALRPRHARSIVLSLLALASAVDARAELRLVLRTENAAESLPAAQPLLYVAPDTSPSPFLEVAPFTAEWTGWLHVDLRGDFRFQARHSGLFRLEINGSNVLQSAHAPANPDWSPPVRLRKGTNSLRATLTRTNLSEAYLRLSWTGRGVSPSLVPASSFTPPAPDPSDPALDLSAARRGRQAFLVHRCARCHDPETRTPIPDLALDAPSLVGMGSRRSSAWLARWITNPRALRPTATMPQVLHGAVADSEAADITAWLVSLVEPNPPAVPEVRPVAALGHALVESFLCRSCHTLAGEAPATNKVTLAFVAEKFASPDHLAAELRSPHRFDPWRWMPDFQLSSADSSHLAAFLMPAPVQRSAESVPPNSDSIRRGRRLAKERGCLHCHADPESNPQTALAKPAPPARRLAARVDASGCLADTDSPGPTKRPGTPHFVLTPGQRSDLKAFLSADLAALERHVATDFAERWSRELRCAACHAAVEGLPRIDGAGDKLRPEWLARCLAGTVGYKPRPWLASRMPAFPAFAPLLAEGLSAAHGWPPRSPLQPPPDAAAAAVGRQLVAASAGFACVTCHAVGPFQASAVFEAPGVNLAHASDRLLPDFFVRWVRNPQTFDPTTKMPLYFDEEGNSALADYFGGDGPKTLNALWEYLRPGASITPPEP